MQNDFVMAHEFNFWNYNNCLILMGRRSTLPCSLLPLIGFQFPPSPCSAPSLKEGEGEGKAEISGCTQSYFKRNALVNDISRVKRYDIEWAGASREGLKREGRWRRRRAQPTSGRVRAGSACSIRPFVRM